MGSPRRSWPRASDSSSPSPRSSPSTFFQKKIVHVEDNVAAISKQLSALLKAVAYARANIVLEPSPEPSDAREVVAIESVNGALHRIADGQWDGIE